MIEIVLTDRQKLSCPDLKNLHNNEQDYEDKIFFEVIEIEWTEIVPVETDVSFSN